jgi:DNA-binding MarR family transcriptional regulator
VELANRLVERGAIVRRQSEEDRREVLLEITPEGDDLLEKLSAAHWEELKRTGPALTAALNDLLLHSDQLMKGRK